MNTTLLPQSKPFTATTQPAGKTFARLFSKRLLTLVLLAALFAARAFGQAPTVSYSSPQTFITGTAITPLSPTGSNVAVQAYNTVPVTLGSGSNIGYSLGVAADAAGNVYTADGYNNNVWKIPAGGGPAVTIGSGFKAPSAIAVDAAGNIYVADYGDGYVYKMPPGGGSKVIIGSGLSDVEEIAVNAAGDVYLSKYPGSLYKIAAGADGPTVIASNLPNLNGIAVDAAGNVYMGDQDDNTILKLPAGGGAAFTFASGFRSPAGVAVDAAGNVYVADIAYGEILEVAAGSSIPVVIASDANNAGGVAIDPSGNVYSADAGSVAEFKPLGGYYTSDFLPAGLLLNTTTGVISGTPTTVTAAANYTVTAYNSAGVSTTAIVNIGVTPPLPPPAVSYSSPQTFITGTAITPLIPTSSNVAVQAYNPTPVTLGSGLGYTFSVAADAVGNVYAADKNHNLVWKIPAGGGAAVTIGSGLNVPDAIAVDAAGNIYVADEGDGRVYMMSPGGGNQVLLSQGYGVFNQPQGIAVNAAGDLYLSDHGGNVYKVYTGGADSPVLNASNQSNFNVVTIASNLPALGGIAVDAAGNVYAADETDNSILKLPAGGGAAVTLASGFSSVTSVTVDAAGNVYVADAGSGTILEIAAGSSSPVVIGPGLDTPVGVAIDPSGNVYAADNGSVAQFKPLGGYYTSNFLPAGLLLNTTTGVISGTPTTITAAANYTVTAYNSAGVSTTSIVNMSTAAGPPAVSYSGPQTYITGTAITPIAPTAVNIAAQAYNPTPGIVLSNLNGPEYIALDAAGNMYITNNGGAQEYPAAGGPPVTIGSGFVNPAGIAVDAAGNVYVADGGNSYTPDPDPGKVTEIPAGGGPQFTLAAIGIPQGLALDAAGNVYVTDDANNAVYKIPAGGGTPTLISTGFNNPGGLAIDPAGNIWVADNGNNAIKEIPVGGGATVTVGSGDEFGAISSIAIDAAGNVYIVDNNDPLIVEIPAGGGAPINLSANFVYPNGIAVNGAGDLLITDTQNESISELFPTGGFYASALPAGLTINTTTGVISGTPTTVTAAANYTVTAYNMAGVSTAAVVNIGVTPSQPVISYSGPQTYIPGTAITPLSPAGSNVAAQAYNPVPVTLGAGLGFYYMRGVAADAAGNVYTTDYFNNKVWEIPAGGGAAVTIGSGFSYPLGIAVDAAGNIYVADYGDGYVYKMTPGGGSQSVIGSDFSYPIGIAANAAGDVYVTEREGGLYKIAAGGHNRVAIGSTATGAGIAVDAAGNVYAADETDNTILEIPADGGPSTTLASGFNGIESVAVDAAGNVYEADVFGGTIQEIAAGSSTAVVIASGLKSPAGVTIDQSGNVYSANEFSVSEFKPLGGYYTSNFLPAGLLLNTTTGVISGTPTTVKAAANYTVTAYNSTGVSTTAVVNIGVAFPPVTLTALTAGSLALSPVFAPATLSYTASAGSGISSITLTPTANGPNAVITVQGQTVTSGSASASIPLSVGNNSIPIVVTAIDNSSTVTYTITVNRARSANNALASLKTSGGLAKGQTVPTALTETVASPTTGITVTPTLVDNTALVTVNNVPVTSGQASASIPLMIGSNIITIVTTAQNGNTLTYTLTVTRLASAINTLSGLALNSGTLSPVFAAATGSYSANVGYGVKFTVTPTVTDPTATLTINGSTARSGTATAVPLTAGSNTLTIVVTAQNGGTKTYTITVNEAKSSNNTLLSLKTSDGLAKGQTVPVALTESVLNATMGITVTPTMVDPTATITVNSVAVISGHPSANIPLNVGNNTITIVGTAQNGNTLTYTLTVTRAASAINTLSALALNSGTLTPAFAAGTTSYSANVSYGYKLTVTPKVADPTATLTINGIAAASGTATAVPLTVGSNTVTIVVTAQNGSTKTYTVVVNEAKSTVNTLASLKTSGGLAKGQTVPTALTESVSNATTGISVTPTVVDPTATVTVNNAVVTSGSPSAPILLTVGNNTIVIVVTAQNGAPLTYTLTVTRAPASMNTVYEPTGVAVQNSEPLLADDGINVHQGISPNGDGINDFLQIDNISRYPDNNLKIMNRNGQLVFDTKGYDNATKTFDGHSNKTGQMQLPGTYFYELDYTVGGIVKHKTGFLVLKY